MPDQLTQLPRFTWHSNDQSTVSLRTASETKITNKTKQNKIKTLRTNQRVLFVVVTIFSRCDLRIRKWHVALHSFAVLVRPLPACRVRTRTGRSYTGTKVEASDLGTSPTPPHQTPQGKGVSECLQSQIM